MGEDSPLERVTAAAKERQLSHNSLIAYRRILAMTDHARFRVQRSERTPDRTNHPPFDFVHDRFRQPFEFQPLGVFGQAMCERRPGSSARVGAGSKSAAAFARPRRADPDDDAAYGGGSGRGSSSTGAGVSSKRITS
jgi:hypothetical protein